jgi:hypothetical protein
MPVPLQLLFAASLHSFLSNRKIFPAVHQAVAAPVNQYALLLHQTRSQTLFKSHPTAVRGEFQHRLILR